MERNDIDPDGTLWISPKDEEIVYRKYKTFSVNEKDLEVSSAIGLRLHWLNAAVKAKTQDIKDYKLITTQGNGQCKYHYPIKRWDYFSGSPEWLERIYTRFQWTLN